jgi:hypothetical protein
MKEEAKKADAGAVALLVDNDGNVMPHFQAYIRYEDAYHRKVEARNKAYASACKNPMQLQQWPQDGVVYQDDIDAARNRWMVLGFKVEIERALDTLLVQGATSAMTLIARAKAKYQHSLHDK